MENNNEEQESLENTKKLLLKWKNDKNIQKLKEFYNTKSFSGILGVERKEISHSNFIAWILNDTESHNLGQFAIRQLFDILLEYGVDKIKHSLTSYNHKNHKNLHFNKLYTALMLNLYIVEDLKIDVESSFKGGRVYILVSMTMQSSKNGVELPEKINIIIENKVDSSEHGSQTKTYYDYYTTNKNYKNDLNLFVFLLPISTLELSKQSAECEHFININYQLLSDNILERALDNDISDRIKFIINEYLFSLRKPTKKNKGQTMATGKFEKELLKDFWENNKDLLVSLFPIIAEDEKDEQLQINLRSVSSAIKEARDNTKYNFNGEYSLSKSKLPFKIVKKYIQDNQNADLENIRETFGFTQSQIKKIGKTNNIKNTLYNTLQLSDGMELLIMNNCWLSNNLNKLIAKAKTKKYIIEETK